MSDAEDYRQDEAIYASLAALQITPAEIAAALGIDLEVLWGYSGGDRRVPDFVLHRLASLLQERAGILRELAKLLSSGVVAQRLLLVS
ncbi:MAG TPA: hypothetical protein VJ672_09220 [Gemmatimonadaceae bacterium]|nr:hypothetical protein [Gemmatimonadaceae bacterium]